MQASVCDDHSMKSACPSMTPYVTTKLPFTSFPGAHAENFDMWLSRVGSLEWPEVNMVRTSPTKYG